MLVHVNNSTRSTNAEMPAVRTESFGSTLRNKSAANTKMKTAIGWIQYQATFRHLPTAVATQRKSMNAIHTKLIAESLKIRSRQIENTIQLFSEGATIPFIARYRKEATGSLDEAQIADIQKEWKKLVE